MFVNIHLLSYEVNRSVDLNSKAMYLYLFRHEVLVGFGRLIVDMFLSPLVVVNLYKNIMTHLHKYMMQVVC